MALWMKLFGSATAKRTRLWSSSWAIAGFNRGKLCRSKHKSDIKTTNRYVKDGKTRFSGNANLRATQRLEVFGKLLCPIFLAIW